MNPAYSVIFLTVLIGAGQGLFLALYGCELAGFGASSPPRVLDWHSRTLIRCIAWLNSWLYLGKPACTREPLCRQKENGQVRDDQNRTQQEADCDGSPLKGSISPRRQRCRCLDLKIAQSGLADVIRFDVVKRKQVVERADHQQNGYGD
jgi:hypothetical protein